MRLSFRGVLAAVLHAGLMLWLLFYFGWGDGKEVVTWVSDTSPFEVRLSMAEVFSFGVSLSLSSLSTVEKSVQAKV